MFGLHNVQRGLKRLVSNDLTRRKEKMKYVDVHLRKPTKDAPAKLTIWLGPFNNRYVQVKLYLPIKISIAKMPTTEEMITALRSLPKEDIDLILDEFIDGKQ